MSAKQFLFRGLLFILIFFAVYLLLFLYQLGAPLKAGYWIQHINQYKNYRADSIKRKKIIIIAGSNALFGVNSAIIEKKTGYPVANMASNAGLDLSFLYYQVKNTIRTGDIVVMPLEFDYYTSQNNNYSKDFSNGMMIWGIDYLKNLSNIDLAKFIRDAEPVRILEGVIAQYESNSTNKNILSQQEVLGSLKKLWKKKEIKWRGYSYKSLNKYGEWSVDEPVQYMKDSEYLKDTDKISHKFVQLYNKIKKLAKDKNGTLVLTYPVTIKNKEFDLSTKKDLLKIKNFKAKLHHRGISIYCDAAIFNMDRKYFFDLPYHTNRNGAKIRSENLAACLIKNELLQK